MYYHDFKINEFFVHVHDNNNNSVDCVDKWNSTW